MAGDDGRERAFEALFCEGQKLAGLVPKDARVEEVELFFVGGVIIVGLGRGKGGVSMW